MPVTVSTRTMVDQLEALLHTRDLTIREADFVAAVVGARDDGRLQKLTERQVGWLADLHRKHFAT